MRNFFIALRYARNYKLFAGLNVLFNILSAIFNLLTLLLFIPFLNLLFTRDVSTIAETPNQDAGMKDWVAQWIDSQMLAIIQESGKVGALFTICMIILVLFFLKNLTRYLAMYFLAVIRNGVVRDLRASLFKKLLALPLGYYTEERKGDLMTRVSGDVYEVELSIMSTLELIFREPFTIVIFLTSMILISPSLTMISLVLMPLSALVIGRIGKSLKRTSVKGQAKMGELMANVEEMLSGLRIIKSFTAEDQVSQKFSVMNEDYNKLSIRMYRKRDLASPLSEFLGSVVMIALVWFGGKLILEGDQAALNGSEFIGFVIVFSQLLRPIQGIATAQSNINKGLASIDRINEVLGSDERILETGSPIAKNTFEEKIEYKNVVFAYREGTVVLDDVSLIIPKGKSIALVGQSGSGKSTLADLLPRFYDVTAGSIQVDGVDIRELKISDLRKMLGVVSQESMLFNDTVAANIALGDPRPDKDRVVEAARVANALEFIERMENGMNTVIGERGSKLSGGQRQRLAIARAVYKNPPVLILDEATSALDTESEKLVQEALTELMKNRTSLVIAHRLSTIQHADLIIVMQSGKIMETGTHQELLEKGGIYKKLCDMQSFQ